jgi:hypothetical protein
MFAGGFGPSHGLSLADSKPTKGIMRRGRNHPLFLRFPAFFDFWFNLSG